MIGTLRETSLHAALKEWAALPGDRFEVEVDGYVIDLQRGETLIEIQTRNFAAIKRKLTQLVERHPVRLLHPIAQEKHIIRLPAKGGEPISRRKSPKRGTAALVFMELVSFPELIAHPNFSLEVLLTREEEIQRPGRGGTRNGRRKGWRIADRRLVEVVERVVLASPADFQRFLPDALPQPFTSRDLADVGHYPLYLSQKMTRFACLRKMGVIEVAGKRRGAVLYLRNPQMRDTG